jgi:lipopolysaccharide transport system ATP-binding protein
MKQMRDNGLTLLFVSHSTDAVKDVCEKGLFLNQGNPVYWGTAAEASDQYLKYMRELANQEKLQSQANLPPPVPLATKISNSLRYGTGYAQIVRVEVTDDEGLPCASFEFEDYINIHMYFKAMVDITDLSATFAIRDNTGIAVMGTSLVDERKSIPFVPAGTEGYVHFRFINHLRHGNYGVGVGLNRVKEHDLSDNMVLDYALACATFQVVHDPERPIWYKFYGSIDLEYEVGQYSGRKDHSVDSKRTSSKM